MFILAYMPRKIPHLQRLLSPVVPFYIMPFISCLLIQADFASQQAVKGYIKAVHSLVKHRISVTEKISPLQPTFFPVFCCLLSSSLLPFSASLLTPAFLLTFLLCLTLLPSPFTSCFSCYSTFSCTFDIPTFLQVNYYRLLAVLLAHTLMYPCRHLLSLLLLANLSMLLAR